MEGYEAVVKETARRLESLRVAVTEHYFTLTGSDPMLSLPLTEYQKGLLRGRIEALENACIELTVLKNNIGSEVNETVKEND